MPTEVSLTLVADNSKAVQSVKELEKESSKLYTNNEKNQKRQVGLIADIEKELGKLQTAQKNAMTLEHITKYNQKIAEAKKSLQEYNEAGVKAEKATESMGKSFAKWAAGLGLVATLLNELKKSFKDTTLGINSITTATELWTQATYNLVTMNATLNNGLVQALATGKMMNELRKKERVDLVEIARFQRTYNELYFAASDRRRTDAERIQILDQALMAHNLAVDREIENLREQQTIVAMQLINRPKSNKLLDEEARLIKAVEDAEASRYSGVKRIESLRTGMLQEQTENRKKLNEALIADNKEFWNDYADWFVKNLEKIESDPKMLERLKKMTSEIIEGIDNLDGLYGSSILEKALLGEKSPLKFNADIVASNKDLQKQLLEVEKQVGDQRRANFDQFSELALDYMTILEDLSQREVDDAERRRELFDTRISETQMALNSEIELYKAGYASNVAAKQKELEALKIQRDKALADEERARKRSHQINVAALIAQKAVDIAKVISATSVANAEARITASLPIPGMRILAAAMIAQNRIAAAISIAAITASIAAAATSKYAKGGWTGDGGMKDETGERIAGIVHEREYVIRRGPARKFRGVLEAINRDDKRMILNSFNKLSPELLGGMNNILIENNGPNKRLDEVNSNLRRIHAKEEVITSGNVTIIKKGNTITTIRR